MTVNEETGLKESEIGKIPENWETISFDKVISHIVDNRGKTAPTSKNGIALIATNCIKENALYPAKEKIRYVSKETYENWFRDHPKPDDIIIVNKGTPGMVCLVPSPVDFVIAQDMVAVRPNKSRIYGRFLFAFMRSKIFKHEVDSLIVGTTIPHLKKTYFPLLTVPLPSKDEQIAIGDAYFNLSEKIETNLKMNETLEAVGQAVFRRWFVDFEFPNEEGKPYKSSSGEMTYNEEVDKEIPEGWVIGSLSDICEVTMGQSPPGETYNETEDGVPFFQGIRDFGFRFPSKRVYCTAPTRFAQEGDVLLSVRAPVGSLNVADVRCAIGRGVAAIRLEGKQNGFLYYLLLSTRSGWEIYESKGTVFGSATKQDVHNFKIIIPPKNLRDRFGELIAALDKRILFNEKESRILSAIRDSLLPKLMSGKIRVPIVKDNREAS